MHAWHWDWHQSSFIIYFHDMDKDPLHFIWNWWYSFYSQDLKLMHLTVYMISMLVRLLKSLNNVISCQPLDAPTLNPSHEMDCLPYHYMYQHGKATQIFTFYFACLAVCHYPIGVFLSGSTLSWLVEFPQSCILLWTY